MFRRRARSVLLAALTASVMVVSGCGGSGSTGSDDGPVGDPVFGGTATFLQITEPRNLDPTSLANAWTGPVVFANGVYGTLMTNDPETLEVSYQMATDLVTEDGGNTFLLTLRPDLVFTDGTPFDAEAVKVNWDRAKEPTVSGALRAAANLVAASEVVDATTLKLQMDGPTPNFAQAVVSTPLNWIASPTALAKPRDEFDANPVGAGPFKLTRWTRQDSMELERNPDYYDAPKPYLDSLVIRTAIDSNQRLNSVTTGGVDLASESNPDTLERAEQAGLRTGTVPASGGQFFAMNTTRAPFDDIRARQAVAQAIDLEAVNIAAYNGAATVPTTLLDESSPYYTGETLSEYDAEEAQRLFDELAAEGKPVRFKITSVGTHDSKAPSEALQAQLSAFDNVDVEVEMIDFPTMSMRSGAKDFDMMIASVTIQDPDTTLWRPFYSDSDGNITGLASPELDAALVAGRVAESQEDRQAAYADAEKQIAEFVPGVFYARPTPSIMYGKNLQGVEMYTTGSILPAEIWSTK